MPLILLGFLVILGIVIYALVRYGQSEENAENPLGERVSDAFESFATKLAEVISDAIRKGASYTVMDDDDDDGGDDDGPGSGPDGTGGPGGDDHTLFFPVDAEVEKRKRNIH